MNALDLSDSSTLWNSDHQSSNKRQIYQINFNRTVDIRKLYIVFQGGFVGVDCELLLRKDEEAKFQKLEDAYVEPDDTNELQEFIIPDSGTQPICTALRLSFGKSTDFYGRIMIYRFEVWGYEDPN
mmetsp:Transcript_12559/g.15270  ORF Transcript_12559/g.15270 Transcript_12559/m.15270 type:complete len:126 (-) Transcript_12559:231-608(-)